MYSDGNRKTISELHREAATLRKQIEEETLSVGRARRYMARANEMEDTLYRLFARELEHGDRQALVNLLSVAGEEEIQLEQIPLFPVAVALSNGQFNGVHGICAVNNRFVDDNSVIFLAHVIRFSPAASQLQRLDISGTKVTEKGLSFLFEMIVERKTPFTLVAKERKPPEVPVSPSNMTRFEELLKRLEAKGISVAL